MKKTNKHELKFKDILNTIVNELFEANTRATKIHGTGNIKSSGDEVENLIREKISLFLPERYMVKQGHLINSDGLVSPQLDIIIFDKLNTPKFFQSNNNTVYYPIEAVLAIGEIKKTFRKNDALEFREKIKFIKENMKRKLHENPVYGGIINNNASISDIVNLKINRKYKNPLFSFIFSINECNIADFKIDTQGNYLPNAIYVLNFGEILYGKIENVFIKPLLEDENQVMKTWVISKTSSEICLGMFFNQLIEHLNDCYIEPFGISNYMSNINDFSIKGSDITCYSLNS